MLAGVLYLFLKIIVICLVLIESVIVMVTYILSNVFY